jgi:hypothetical protein
MSAQSEKTVSGCRGAGSIRTMAWRPPLSDIRFKIVALIAHIRAIPENRPGCRTARSVRATDWPTDHNCETERLQDVQSVSRILCRGSKDPHLFH